MREKPIDKLIPSTMQKDFQDAHDKQIRNKKKQSNCYGGFCGFHKIYVWHLMIGCMEEC